jgi:hypothetical protein
VRKKGLRVHWYSLERKTRGSVFARGSKAQILEYTDDSEIILIRTKSFCGNVGLPFTNDGRRSAIALDIKSVFGIFLGGAITGAAVDLVRAGSRAPHWQTSRIGYHYI